MHISVVVALLVVSGCSAIQTVSDPPVTIRELAKSVDPQVRLDRQPVPDSQNGWQLAARAGKQAMTVHGSTDLTANPSTEEVEQAKKMLVGMQESFRLLRNAASRPVWAPAPPRQDEIPNLDDTAATTFPAFAALKTLVKALTVQARLESGQNGGSAARDMTTAFLVGKRLTAGHGSLIQYLVGIACEAVAARRMGDIVHEPGIGWSELRRMLAAVQADPASHFDSTLKVEFNDSVLRTFAGIPDPAKGIPAKVVADLMSFPPDFFQGVPISYDRRETARDASKIVAVAIRNARSPWSRQEDLSPEIEAATKGLPDTSPIESVGTGADDRKPLSSEDSRSLQRKFSSVPNSFGKLLIRDMMPIFAQAQEAEFRRLATERATAVVLASAIERRATGHGPSRLSELYRWGLSKASSIDPFSGSQFRIDASRGVFWSVGADGKDDGGKDRPWHAAAARDYVWALDGRSTGTPPPPKPATSGYPPPRLK